MILVSLVGNIKKEVTQISNKKNNDCVTVIPLGGLGEIGKNMTAIKCHDEIIVIEHIRKDVLSRLLNISR